MEPDDGHVSDEHPITTPIVIDYGRPAPAKYFFTQPVGIMIWISLTWLLIVEIFYGAALDGGVTNRRVTTTWLAYCFVAAIILIRHRRGRRLTKIDLGFIGFGYPVFVLITEPFVR